MDSLSSDSRVWVYQSTRLFSEQEAKAIEERLRGFAQEWTAHSRSLAASGAVLHNRFLVLAVDESRAGASGCSIDKSVQFLEGLEKEFRTNLFDRLTFAYQIGGEIKTASLEELKGLYQAGAIGDGALYFDNLVGTLTDLRAKWLKPIKGSKLERLLK